MLGYPRKNDNGFRAVIESALVTWIGILVYEITSLAPAGHIIVRTVRFELHRQAILKRRWIDEP